MEVVRCAECGSRLNAGYCPMCMKRIPLTERKKEASWRQRTYAPTRGEEDHECVSFDIPAKKPARSVRKTKKSQKSKPAVIIAILAAVFSLVSTIGEIVNDLSSDAVDVEPEINHSAYIKAGQPGADGLPRLEPVELYREGGITIIAESMGLYYDDQAICVMIQNDSEQDVTISSTLLCVNGYMLPTSGLFAQVEGEDWYQTYLYLYADELEEAGIEQVATVSFGLDIYDSEEYTDVGEMYPSLLVTEAEVSQPAAPEGKVLYDLNGVRILLQSTELGSYGDCDVTLYLENTTDDLVTVFDTGMYINEQEATGMLWSALMPQSRAVAHISFYELEELDITDLADIQEVLIDLHIEHSDGADLMNWRVLERVDTAITFNPTDMD